MYINILKKFQGHCFGHFAAYSGRDRRLLSVINSMPVLIRRLDETTAIVWSGVSSGNLGSCSNALCRKFTAGRPQHRPLLCLGYVSSGNEARLHNAK